MQNKILLPDYVKKLITRFENNGFEAYAVGGCVRDSLLGITPSDWDVCTSAIPSEVISLFSDCTIIPTGLKHGTVSVKIDKHLVEITTFRSDGAYSDSRHPKNVFFEKDIKNDLLRRDFTINAIAYSDRTGIIDPFDGIKDLSLSILRCVGCARARFSEDALRILRGLRFAAAYGLNIEKETAKAMYDCSQNLLNISAERVSAELKKIISAKYSCKILIEYQAVIFIILPGFSKYNYENDLWLKSISLVKRLPDDFDIRMSAILYYLKLIGLTDDEYSDICKKILKSLKLDRKSYTNIISITMVHELDCPDSIQKTRLFIKKYGRDLLKNFILWKTAVGSEKIYLTKKYFDIIESQSLCCTVSDLAISGKDLISSGIPCGSEIGVILDKLLTAVICEDLPNDRINLSNRAKKYYYK